MFKFQVKHGYFYKWKFSNVRVFLIHISDVYSFDFTHCAMEGLFEKNKQGLMLEGLKKFILFRIIYIDEKLQAFNC